MIWSKIEQQYVNTIEREVQRRHKATSEHLLYGMNDERKKRKNSLFAAEGSPYPSYNVTNRSERSRMLLENIFAEFASQFRDFRLVSIDLQWY